MQIMIVEDEYHIAQQLAREILEQGDEVVGPFASVHDAVLNVEKAEAAILDIKLGSEDSFAVAEILRCREQPFLFLTGYDRSILPQRFSLQHVYYKPSHALPMLSDLRAQRDMIPVETRIEQVVREMLVTARQAMPDRASAERLVEATMVSVIAEVTAGTLIGDIRQVLLHRMRQELTHGRGRHLQ
jgi:CheY-like chemotaxis protein